MSVYEICKKQNAIPGQGSCRGGTLGLEYTIDKICDTHTHIQDSLTIVLSRLFKVYSRKNI